MPENTTWVEVADTSVKIGLSGIIAALSGYFLAKNSYRNQIELAKKNQALELDKEYFRRRQDVIEKVSASFEEIHAFFFKVCIDYQSFVQILHAGLTASESDRGKYQEYIQEIGKKFHQIHLLEGKLSVAGADKVTLALQQYRLQGVEVNDMIKLVQPTKTKSDVELITNELFKRKDKFYVELAEAFKKI
jgi:hypothetical protein